MVLGICLAMTHSSGVQIIGFSSQLCLLSGHICNLNTSMVKVFTPQKLAKITNQYAYNTPFSAMKPGCSVFTSTSLVIGAVGLTVDYFF